MAYYRIFGIGPSLTESNGPAANGVLDFIYGAEAEFGIMNPDGTRTYVQGSGFTYDWSGTGTVTGGTVTGISHFDASGKLLDTVTDLVLNATDLATETGNTTTSFNLAAIFSGDDVINARIRPGKAIVDDAINAWGGNDKIYAGAGDDLINGGSGNDFVHAATGDDYVIGGAGSDRLYGREGVDILIGDDLTSSAGADRDVIYGGFGNDIMVGGGGNDFIDGGSGRDTAAYFVLFEDLEITLADGGLRVVSDAGADRLYNTERIATLDGTYEWNEAGTGYEKINNITSLQLTGYDGDLLV